MKLACRDMCSEEATSWHKWFAWHPVITNKGSIVWMEKVERKSDGDLEFPEWNYRRLSEHD